MTSKTDTEKEKDMFESGESVSFLLTGELEHVVSSPKGLRASIRVSDELSITVPYPRISRAEKPEPERKCSHCGREDHEWCRKPGGEKCDCACGSSGPSEDERIERRARELREDDDPVNTWEQATEKQREFWRKQAHRETSEGEREDDLDFGIKKHCSCMSSFDGEGDGMCPVHWAPAPASRDAELIAEAKDYALALHASTHVRHTGAELIDRLVAAYEEATK